MNSLYPISQIRQIEQAAQATLAAGTLMQRAGIAVADAALELIKLPHQQASILVLAGPGDNGGDALEAAAHLAQHGLPVVILLYAAPDKQSAAAQQALGRAQNGSATFIDCSQTNDVVAMISSAPWALVIDGLFGIGLKRPLPDRLHQIVNTVNRLNCVVLALDVPSGLDADTGNIVGDPQGGPRVAVRASHTITFIADKPGLHTCDGRDLAGQVQVARLGIDDSLFPASAMRLNHPDLFAAGLRPRKHNSHKGSFGDVAVIGGASGMAGATILGARTAAQCGAGRVFAAFLQEAPSYDTAQPELMCRRAHELDFTTMAVVIGPGLGTSAAARDILLQTLQADMPLVLDADALNLIAAESSLQKIAAQRQTISLMTPHPLEAARLLGSSGAAVQLDRLSAARRLASQYSAVVILKGSGTVIAGVDGEIVINPNGNAGLATAGSGDVLAGLCGALLAQGWPVWEAALAAVWLHGAAADTLVAQGIGPIGLTAGELIPILRDGLNRLTVEQARL